MKNYLISSVFTVMTCLLAGCAHPPAPTKAATPSNEDGPAPYAVNLSKIHNAIPKSLPRSKYGNPREYMALGKRYHVLRSANGYDKVGFASWYGWKFHKHLTSSRESYDMFAMTAASPTLPIPTFVKVTNLKKWTLGYCESQRSRPIQARQDSRLNLCSCRKVRVCKPGYDSSSSNGNQSPQMENCASPQTASPIYTGR